MSDATTQSRRPRPVADREPATVSTSRPFPWARLQRWGYPLAAIGIVIALWEACVWFFELPHYILPAPSRVLLTIIERHQILAWHTGITLTEVIAGCAIGIAVGLALGTVMFFSAPMEKALYPLLVTSQNVPVFAIAPLLVVWFGYGWFSKVIMAGIIVFFPVTVSLLDGLKRTDQDYVRLFRTMGARPAQIFWKLRVPAALPNLMSGLKLAAIYSTIGAVIGEWVGAGAGLGYLMLSANAQLRVSEVFAAILCLTPIGLFLLGAVVCLERWLLPWQRTSRDEPLA
jgi:ABC-type nitrate/sulfonate/bicarbonate transport system permease component